MIFALGGGLVRAEGIALSTDGLQWLPGVGGYGHGWGAVGRGISVKAGSTIYIRYYSDAGSDAALHYAVHGTNWGSWVRAGPVLDGTVGRSRTNPVILKVARVGTPTCSIVWMNGSGAWSGPSFPGVYDLALGGASMWTLPPLVISSRTTSPWWSGLARLFSSREGPPDGTAVAVPDSGGPVAMLACAIVCAVAGKWLVGRRARGEKSRTAHAGGRWKLRGSR